MITLFNIFTAKRKPPTFKVVYNFSKNINAKAMPFKTFWLVNHHLPGRWWFTLCILILFIFNCNSRGTTTDSVNILVTRDSLKNVEIALELYKREFGEYPESLEELLIRKGITNRNIIQDAWGRPYHYVKTVDSYILFSKGRDKKPYTPDDVHPPQ